MRSVEKKRRYHHRICPTCGGSYRNWASHKAGATKPCESRVAQQTYAATCLQLREKGLQRASHSGVFLRWTQTNMKVDLGLVKGPVSIFQSQVTYGWWAPKWMVVFAQILLLHRTWRARLMIRMMNDQEMQDAFLAAGRLGGDQGLNTWVYEICKKEKIPVVRGRERELLYTAYGVQT